MRRFLNRLPDGGGPPPSLDPYTLSWEILLDSRQITGVANGGNINPWPDSSGNARNAAFSGAQLPIYRSAGLLISPTGEPLADFNLAPDGADLSGPLPVAGIPMTNGMTVALWYQLPSVKATVFTGTFQRAFNSAAGGTGWFANVQYAWQQQDGCTLSRVLPIANQGIPNTDPIYCPSVTNVTIGAHTLILVCRTPKGVAAGGTQEIYLDGSLVATRTNWDAQPNTSYNIGSGGGGSFFAGQFGWASMGAFALTAAEVSLMHGYLHRAFG